MAIFVEAETARRRRNEVYSPAAKLRELRSEMGHGAGTERELRTDVELAERPRAEPPPRRKHTRQQQPQQQQPPQQPQQPPQTQQPVGGQQPQEPMQRPLQRRRPGENGRGGGTGGGRRCSESKSFTCGCRPRTDNGSQPSSVQGLKERTQREEATRRERESKKAATSKLLDEWHARTRGNVYEMLRTCHHFTDLFTSDPLKSVNLVSGDQTSLKKAWHLLAAKLHPDRQRGNPTATQVLAEEIFKVLTLAVQKENDRLGKRI